MRGARSAAARESLMIEADLGGLGPVLRDLLRLGPPGGRDGTAIDGSVDGIMDPETGAHYFFHAHEDPAQDPREWGHFHLFLDQLGMESDLAPFVFPELALAPLPRAAGASMSPEPPPLAVATGAYRPAGSGRYCHLIGVALDHRACPITLFTANQWMTGETWYRGSDVVRMLAQYRFPARPEGANATAHTAARLQIGRWLAALTVILYPRIASLVLARDQQIMAWRRRGGVGHVLADRRLTRPSSCTIDFTAERAMALAAV